MRSSYGGNVFPILAEQFFIIKCQVSALPDTEEKIVKLRDPLFVIETSLAIIKNRSSDEKIQPELERIASALTRIEQIIK